MEGPSPGQGQCTLVGAGPGDPDLLTLAAVKALQRASVLLVDDLVNEAVLQWAPDSARIVHVGKRGGCQSTPQAFIQRLMLQEVQAGENVVRLKGAIHSSLAEAAKRWSSCAAMASSRASSMA